jgi:hypothetical protein
LIEICARSYLLTIQPIALQCLNLPGILTDWPSGFLGSIPFKSKSSAKLKSNFSLQYLIVSSIVFPIKLSKPLG